MPERTAALVADRVAGAVVVALGAGALVAARGLEYGGPVGPGPGFLPTWLGIGLVVCGALLVLTRLRARPGDEPVALPDRAALARVGAAAAAIIAVALLLEPLGFVPSAAALVLFCVLALARRSLRLAVALAVALPATFYVVFQVWLGIGLPRGVLGI